MTQPEQVSEPAPMATWEIPGIDPAISTRIDAYAGEITTIVGANGAGKSALGFRLDHGSGGLAKRLIAHRKLWFPNAGPDLSPAQREQTGRNMDTWKTSEDSRFLDHADGSRASIVLFDLLAMINAQNSQMVELYKGGSTPDQVTQHLGSPVLDRLNMILRDSGLPVTLQLTTRQTFDAVNSETGDRYPINRMSDGEKSALLLGSEIISGPPGRIFIIDEPERHLHRSISAGLVDAIITDRADCHFVVLTHDLDLASALSQRAGQTFSLASCRWEASDPAGWDLVHVDPGGHLPEAAQLAILGGRRNLLFIEGDQHSLDKRLYELLFPGWTLFATGGCEQVIRAVTGLRTSIEHHWVTACGVVDGDGRNEEERQSLLTRGILSLPVSEVENLYYLNEVLRSVAEAQAGVLGAATSDMHERARLAALHSLTDNETLDRLGAALAVSALRRKFVENIPTTVDGTVDPIEISIPSPYAGIRQELGELAAAGDYDGLVKLVPVRDTALRSRVTRELGFTSLENYEAAVRVRLRDDAALRERLRGLIGPVPIGA